MTAIPSTPAPGATSGNPSAVPLGHAAFTPQERELFEAICRYALTEDRDDLAVVGGLYVAYARATPIARRLQLLDAVTVGVGDGTIPVRAYHPFLFHDSQSRVIAEATSRVSVCRRSAHRATRCTVPARCRGTRGRWLAAARRPAPSASSPAS